MNPKLTLKNGSIMESDALDKILQKVTKKRKKSSCRLPFIKGQSSAIFFTYLFPCFPHLSFLRPIILAL